MSVWKERIRISPDDVVCPMCGHVLWPSISGDKSKWCDYCYTRYWFEEVKRVG